MRDMLDISWMLVLLQFPFLFGGTFIEGVFFSDHEFEEWTFPFLFGGTFIEGRRLLRLKKRLKFPFLFGGTFIEGLQVTSADRLARSFPFLFGGTFIEGYAEIFEAIDKSEISLPFRRDFH